MGFLDGLIGNVVGSILSGNESQDRFGAPGNRMQSGNLLLQLALSMLQQNGGLQGVLDKFRQGGMAQHADSWMSTGQNINISAEHLQQVFGSSAIRDVASRLGLSEDQAGSEMAQILPQIIDGLTPQGRVPDNSDEEIAEGLSMLANSAPRR